MLKHIIAPKLANRDDPATRLQQLQAAGKRDLLLTGTRHRARDAACDLCANALAQQSWFGGMSTMDFLEGMLPAGGYRTLYIRVSLACFGFEQVRRCVCSCVLRLLLVGLSRHPPPTYPDHPTASRRGTGCC